ncbi:hypothetical protein HDU98_009976 [Podochytrium sp. JEL0797]|nr:hypothetical protein HDU98_009976 [Podochytrium sp. JEL0797]
MATGNSWVAYPVAISTTTKIDYLSKNTDYSLYITINNEPQSTQCPICVAELTNTGGSPLVTSDSETLSIISLPNAFVKTSTLNQNYWAYPMRVGSASGLFGFEVDSTGTTPRLSQGALDVGTFRLSTGWVASVLVSMGIPADIATSQDTTATAASFSMTGVPGASTVLVGALNSGTSSSAAKVLLSNNFFTAWTSLSLSTSFADSDRCGTSLAYFKSGGSFADAILLNTMNGVIGASSQYSSTSFNWQPLVPNCIGALKFPQQQITNREDVTCLQAVALGARADAGRAWLVQGSGSLNSTEVLIYFGNVATKTLILVQHAPTPAPTTAQLPYFDHANNLHVLTVTVSVGSFSTATKALDVDTIVEFAEYTAGVAGAGSCPYSRIVFVDDAGTGNVVERQDTGILASQSLPTKIYLDYLQSYTFTLRLTPSPGTPTASVSLGFLLSNHDAVQISHTRSVVGDSEVEYRVVVTDLGAQGQTFPGLNLKSSVVRVTPLGANFACKELEGRSWKTKLSQSILVYSGCAPYQQMQFVWTDSSATQACPNPDPLVPCLFYVDAFPLHFSISNQLTSTSTPFLGTYQLQITGGGPSLSSKRNYSNTEIARYNPSSSSMTSNSGNLVWSDTGGAEITWVCQPSSPCYGLTPTTASTTPHYYFTFHITTLSPTFTMDPQPSYCILESDFDVQVYGVEVSFGASAAVTLGVWCAFVIMVVGVATIDGCIESRRRRRVVVPEESGGGSDETLLPEYEAEGTEKSVSKEGGGVKKVRLTGYKGPEKPTEFVRTLFQRKRNLKKVHAVVGEVGVSGVASTPADQFARPVQAAMGQFKQRRESQKREKLLAEHLSGSRDLVEALRELKNKKEI